MPSYLIPPTVQGGQSADVDGTVNHIGAPGRQGFGVGLCPALPAGFAAMAGSTDIAHDNYGNYQYSDGSVMCWVPAFYLRLGHVDNPTYATYGVNSVDIRALAAFANEDAANASGYYDNAEALPIPYGRAVTLTPVEYGDTRRHWLVADCAIGGVDAVSIDGEPTSAWSWRNGTDSTGHPVAWLELGDALPAGAKLTATLRGRLSPDDGSLVLSPDAILYDVLRHLLGMDIDSADLDDFRAQVAGIELAGVLNDTSRSIRAVIDEIMQSIGAAWSATAPGIAALWPLSASDHESVTEYSALLARDLEPTTSHDSIANVIRLNYSQDWTTGSTTQTVQLEHADSIATYGRIEREWQAKWLPSERQATALCTRLLAALASPRWTVTAAIDSTAIDLMHQVQITSSAFTTTPERIESIDLDYQRGKASATITLAG